MQKLLTSIVTLLLVTTLISCNSSKKAVDQGNYDKAITDASLALKKNRNNSRQALILEEAYKKATDRDLALIEQLESKTADDATSWVAIFNIYDRMLIREVAILPLLPLEADGRQLSFDLPNVDEKASMAKNYASSALYRQARELLSRNDRQSARQAYEVLDQLIEFNFNYEDARELRDRAKIKGSVNVFVTMNNKTGKALPATFQDDLLTFREGSFTDPWIVYHTKRDAAIKYDYNIDLDINQLVVGRNDKQQRQYREQKQVIVGYKQQKNNKGETVQVPQYSNVYADVLETLQTKPIRVAGTVLYKNAAGQQVNSIPVSREEAWQNNYAQFRGDQRALTQETIAKIQKGEQQFPTDQQLYEVSGKLLNQAVVALFEQNAPLLK